MDELGGCPRVDFSDRNQYTRDADQNGSWFGLAISGLRFLINNQRNDSINHDYQANSPPSPSAATKHHSTQSKLHILGPSVFKKQLYDIPEYQSTASSSSGDKKKGTRCSTNSRLTKRALQQFNGNFSNYWNQRSSLHQTSEAGSTDAPSVRSKRSVRPVTDGGSSTVPRPTEELELAMASSQIIHPTQDKPPRGMKRSRSFPMLHSAEITMNILVETSHYFEEGSNRSIPSPPPISNSAEVIDSGFMLSNVKGVRPIKSGGSNNDDLFSNHSNDSLGMVFVDHFHRKGVRKSMSALRVSDLGSNSGSLGMEEAVSLDWEVTKNETISMISKPLPKSIRKKKRKKKVGSPGRREEDEVSFSDWSNVSSNIGVTTTPSTE